LGQELKRHCHEQHRLGQANKESIYFTGYRAAAAAAAVTPVAGPSAKQLADAFGMPYREVPNSTMRRTVARRLTEAKQTIPHFYLRRSVELDALMAFRETLNAQLAPRGVKLSINDFIIKACAMALQKVPDANAVWAGDRMFRMKSSDVAVAVAIEGGLFTPVLRDAHLKSLSALSAEMKDLAAKARDELRPLDAVLAACLRVRASAGGGAKAAKGKKVGGGDGDDAGGAPPPSVESLLADPVTDGMTQIKAGIADFLKGDAA
jgi:pyruvate/2-oxoglutarate dehydrogenase complex dihydrolipoamide acyltransferase (E2) component